MVTSGAFYGKFKAYQKPDPETDPVDYVGSYYQWVREENDNMTDLQIEIELYEL